MASSMGACSGDTASSAMLMNGSLRVSLNLPFLTHPQKKKRPAHRTEFALGCRHLLGASDWLDIALPIYGDR